MTVEFIEPAIYDPIKEAVVIKASVNGSEVKCYFTANLIVDTNPDTWSGDYLQQFLSYQSYFEQLARSAIEDGRIHNGSVRITSKDLPD